MRKYAIRGKQHPKIAKHRTFLDVQTDNVSYKLDVKWS